MADFSASDTNELLVRARYLKKNRRLSKALAGQTLGMIFQKPSTRTAVSFAVAMHELGGLALTLNDQQLQLHRGETMADTARTLSRYLAGVMIRANQHADVVELAQHATIPVVNGLTDQEHPCQVLADLMTISEVFNIKTLKGFKGFRVLYVGDGNNMAHSWLLAAGTLGLELVVASPQGYQPSQDFMKRSEALARVSGARLTLTSDPLEAARGARVIYTDVWTSMGQEAEVVRRQRIFRPYQVNQKLLANAHPKAIVMHCLPAHRGEEITSDVLDGPQSVVFDQAENRLHVQKAILLKLLEKKR